MKKATYKIITNQGLIAKDGYLFGYKGIAFGVCRQHSFDDYGQLWEVSELTSGRLFCGGVKRGGAIQRAKDLVDKLGVDTINEEIKHKIEETNL